MQKKTDSGEENFQSTRRVFLTTLALGTANLVFLPIRRRGYVLAAVPGGKTLKQVTIIEFTDAGDRKGKVSVPTVAKTDEEWKKQLSPLAYEVTRRAGTERAYTDEDPSHHQKGIFRCICCETALFSSTTKFESGTGWPSFWAPIAKENIVESFDNSLGMVRTAVSCRRCESHLGHVFNDGPLPTGLRYCMNSVALRFAKAS